MSPTRSYTRFGAGIFLLSFLFGLLFISFLPVKYTAKATVLIHVKQKNPEEIRSENDLIVKTTKDIEQDIDRIRDPEFLRHIFNKLKLKERPEFNPEKDTRRAKISIYYEYWKTKILPPTKQQTTEQAAMTQMLRELSTTTQPPNIEIYYESESQHLARQIVNTIAKEYVQTPSTEFIKEIEKKADLPKIISSPDLIYYLYCTAIVCALLSLCATTILILCNIKKYNE